MICIRKRHWLNLSVLAAVGILLGVFHNHQVHQDRPDPVTGFVRSFMVPLQSSVKGVTEGIGDFFSSITKARAVLSERDKLTAENQSLRMSLVQTDALREENEQLRALLNMRSQLKCGWIASQVIASYTLIGDQALTIDKGTTSGVQVGSPVVAGEGLVGVVVESDKRSAQVRFLTASRIAVSAYVENRARRSAGICEGQDKSCLWLNYLPLNVPVEVGDRVVTAGLGGKYPPGIPIGTVERVTADQRYSTRQAQVRPFVNFDQLEVVLVMRDP